MSNPSFTGRQRSRTTPRRVRVVETIARACISAGGMGTIVAVTLIVAYLIWVVAPLFGGSDLAEGGTAAEAAPARTEVIATGTDELRLMGWVLARDGTVRVLQLDGGELVREEKLLAGAAATAWSFNPDDARFALGFADGTIRSGRLDFASRFLESIDMPDALRGLKPGQSARHDRGMVRVTPEGQFHYQYLRAELDEPIEAGGSAVRRLDFSVTTSGNAYAAGFEDGSLAAFTESVEIDMMTGEERKTLERIPLPFEPPAGRGMPTHLAITGVGTKVFAVWDDGYLLRFDLVDPAAPRVAETVGLVPDGVSVTAVRFLLGKTTLLVGDSTGVVTAWFLIKPDDAGTVDGAVMQATHRLPGPNAAVTALGPSRRTRMLAVGYASGEMNVFHVTTARTLARGVVGNDPVVSLSLSPKEDGVFAVAGGRARDWSFDPGHPEATLTTLFGKVWYEGYPEPQHVWQSTGGSDDFEPKLGLMPLVFGTIKATLYSILIAAPIALLAALYTTEFMDPRLRTGVKSAVEMMASLPSVVLGFLAALVIAPFVQQVVPATLAAFATVPLCFMLGARLWQLLPSRVAMRWSGWPRFSAILLALPAGILLAAALGPVLENEFFAGDIKKWLNRGVGDGVGGWRFLMLPVSALVVIYTMSRTGGAWLRRVSMNWTRLQCALADLARYTVTILATLGLAWGLGSLFGGVMGLDPRGGILDTYAQRNALIVGFVMGFAVVPIIYTLAEDALSSVPQALREGSLGTGATQWQTAWRIIIPTAMSGLFGALMVGLGRAVGETMIVLMAAGNTPILEWNAFNGFRTLSANIAVEMPEAVKDSTHYRTLFLAALVLFAMTFVINTAAEVVRRIFRKRFEDL